MLNDIKAEIVEGFKVYRLGVSNNTSFDLVEIKKSKDYPPHFHKDSRGQFLIVYGKGKIIIDGKKKVYKKNSSFKIPKGVYHGFEPETDTVFLSIQKPPIKNPKTGMEDIEF